MSKSHTPGAEAAGASTRLAWSAKTAKAAHSHRTYRRSHRDATHTGDRKGGEREKEVGQGETPKKVTSYRIGRWGPWVSPAPP